MTKTDKFIEKASIVYNNKYDYSKTIYIHSKEKVIITCKEHGDFLVTPNNHLKISGCPKCSKSAKMNLKTFVEKANKVHEEIYDYSKTKYINIRTNITITCKEHGDFNQSPSDHLQGCGCKYCGKIRSKAKIILGTDFFIEKAKAIHEDKYDYSKSSYESIFEKIIIVCPTHGEFEQSPHAHLKGFGCFKCKYEKLAEDKTCTESDFIEKAKKIHGDTYRYIDIGYTKVMDNISITCPKHGSFKQRANNHLSGCGCPDCSNSMFSKGEKELFEFINNQIKSEANNRSVLDNKELDVYIPSKNLAIEYDGLYWHSNRFKKDQDLLLKTNLCKEKGIKLIHVFEDEWLNKQDIVKSRLKNILGKTFINIFARKCIIKIVSTKEKSLFLNDNHIQGEVGSKINLGLYLNDELVSLMTFGQLRKNLGSKTKEDCWELLRFCNKLNTTVIGGFSKLLTYFKGNYKYEEIISYCDLRWSIGDVYVKNGFKKVSLSKPNYFYVKQIKRLNRFNFRKSELVKQGFDANKTEKQIMKERGFLRIYDCGTIKFNLIREE